MQQKVLLAKQVTNNQKQKTVKERMLLKIAYYSNLTQACEYVALHERNKRGWCL